MKEGDLFIIVDSDCLFINEIPKKFINELKLKGIQHLPFSWGKSEYSNGITNSEFNIICNNLFPNTNLDIDYWSGGEYFAFNYFKLKEFNSIVEELYFKNFELENGLKTEEQLFTLAIKLISSSGISDASKIIRRVWTDKEKYRNAKETDRLLSILHLPAEKTKGFRLFTRKYILENNNLTSIVNYDLLKNLFNLA
jgi:hypothetical protein